MLKDFTKDCQRVWAEKTLDGKKQILMSMIEDFAVKGEGKFKVHQLRFTNRVNNARSTAECDQIATNVAMNKDFKVI